MSNQPTIYEALRNKLCREPTNAELKADVERIKAEVAADAALDRAEERAIRRATRKDLDDIRRQEGW